MLSPVQCLDVMLIVEAKVQAAIAMNETLLDDAERLVQRLADHAVVLDNVATAVSSVLDAVHASVEG